MEHRDVADVTENSATPDQVERLAREQIDETHDVGATPTLAVLPEEMARGAAAGVVSGAMIGAVVLLPLAIVPIGELAVWARLLIVAGIGAVGGGVYGAVNLAGRTAERHPEDGTAHRDTP